jgi:D-alanyl-lipoteichoic acid acyltransferase DltB (MBOAT superfamily)
MLFNSIDFAIFLPIVFLLYWFATKGNYKFQNILLLCASYFFYGCWDWRFLFLLVFSTLLDYFTGIMMVQSGSATSSRAPTRRDERMKKFWFWLSVGVNLGFLGVFKYYNFFATSFAEGLSQIGIQSNFWTLQVILPVGISFYTFHGLSYVIDIYYNRIKPERNFIDYSLFVSFFPLLVAGPIERATHLLPQIKKQRTFDYDKAVDGLRQILWGLFKKIVIADNCATYANDIFNNYQTQSGSTLLLGAIFFSFQIYGDFSGYSDIALGTARLFGIELLRNFAFPYFSRDIAEFWRRWHISLTTWFRDYLYIPLGGSRGGKWQAIRNTFIIFLVSGFWHGANWTFLAWGAFHALLFMPLLLLQRNRKNTNTVAEGKMLPNVKEVFQMGTTFLLVVIGWIFFRADTIHQAVHYFGGMMQFGTLKASYRIFEYKEFWFILILVFIEWIQRNKKHGLELSGVNSHVVKVGIYYILVAMIFYYAGAEQQFIYFQF